MKVFQAVIWEGPWRADEADDLFPKRLFASLELAKKHLEDWNNDGVEWEFDPQTKLHTAKIDDTDTYLVVKEIPVQEE